MKRFSFILFIFLIFPSALSWAQTPACPATEEKGGIYAIVKDSEGETLEGYLRLDTDALTVKSKENQEKSIPLKFVKSITLEKIKGEAPGDDPSKEGYKVRLENSQEIYTLKNKYTFNLNTNLGVVTKTIDPETVNSLFSKDTSQAGKTESSKSFIQDKSIIFSLELKF